MTIESIESIIKLGVGQVILNPAPIRPDWVLEGDPITRNKILSSSVDGTATTLIWDCTAGRFNWFYDVDETIYVIEGSVTVKDFGGLPRRLQAGDTIFFPAGARAEWHVEDYIRKIAFCRVPLPRTVRVAKRGYQFLKRLVGNGGAKAAGPAMFQNS
ncbi:MAG TPA: cupin domain-containing protein [Steroidobacteraceae bacterium]|nr:cupin domain-containing protein [Steroidobacteraceae bacterium]